MQPVSRHLICWLLQGPLLSVLKLQWTWIQNNQCNTQTTSVPERAQSIIIPYGTELGFRNKYELLHWVFFFLQILEIFKKTCTWNCINKCTSHSEILSIDPPPRRVESGLKEIFGHPIFKPWLKTWSLESKTQSPEANHYTVNVTSSSCRLPYCPIGFTLTFSRML